MSKVPPFVMVYGFSGVGKTVDYGFALPKATVVATKGATKSIISTCGYVPNEIQLNSVSEATDLLHQIINSKESTKQLVIDDFSYLVQSSLEKHEEKYKGWEIYGKLREEIFKFRRVAREGGVLVALNCWLQAPKERDDGTRLRGGPKLPSDYTESIPAMCDLVLRAAPYKPYKPHPYCYYAHSSVEWTGKDRDSGTPSPSPMNVGEILRLNGYHLPRLYDWQEEKVEEISEQILVDGRKIARELYTQLLEKLPDNPAIAYWTIRDACDRAVLKKAKENRWQKIQF